MRVLRLTSLILLSLAIVLGPVAPMAHAADGVNLSTSPLPINLSMNPGATITTDIRVKNGNPAPQKLKASLMKFSAYGESGKPALKDREPGDDYFDWVTLTPSTFEAPANQWVTIKMTIKAPKDAAFGYYYAVVFTPQDAKPTGKGNVLLGSTAVLVLLDVKSPNAKKSLQLLSFSADKKLYEFLPATFNVRLHNDGNIHVQPHGDIFISKGNKQVADIRFNSQQGNILPSSNRVFTAAWSDGFPVYTLKQEGGKTATDKNGKPIYELKWDFSKAQKLKFGHYTAHLLAVYDNGKQDVPLDSTLDFWVIPWRVIGILLIVVLLAGVGIWSMSRGVWKKVKRNKPRAPEN